MISINQLRQNLQQSLQWTTMFKQEIKSSLEEITLKNQEIAQLSSNNIDLSAAIENAKRQLKLEMQQKTKVKYKTDKLSIKLEELESRLKLYEEAQIKKQEWNRELQSRIIALEVDVEKERHSLEENEGFQCFSQDKGSDSSVCASSSSHVSFKENSIKKVLGNPRSHLNDGLKRLKNLEENYLKQSEKSRRFEQALQIASRKTQKLQDQLVGLEKSYKEYQKLKNSSKGGFPDENAPVEIRTKAKAQRQLEQRSQRLVKQISNLYQKIEEYSTVIGLLTNGDKEASKLHQQVIAFEREVKKQKSTMHSMKNYVLVERN